MKKEGFIHIDTICECYNLKTEFLLEVQQAGIIQIRQEQYVHEEELNLLEKAINLHNDLGVNVPGIEVAFDLLERVDKLQRQLNDLNNQMGLYDI